MSYDDLSPEMRAMFPNIPEIVEWVAAPFPHGHCAGDDGDVDPTDDIFGELVLLDSYVAGDIVTHFKAGSAFWTTGNNSLEIDELRSRIQALMPAAKPGDQAVLQKYPAYVELMRAAWDRVAEEVEASRASK